MNYTALIKAINSASTQLQSRVAAAVNQALVLRNWPEGAIRGTLSRKFEAKALPLSIRGSLTRELANPADTVCRIHDEVSSSAKLKPICVKVTPEFPAPLSFKELIASDDPWERAFFENECLIPCS